MSLFKLLFFLLFFMSPLSAYFSVDAVLTHDNHTTHLDENDIVFSEDSIKFYFQIKKSTHQSLKIFYKNMDKWDEIYEKKLCVNKKYSFPENEEMLIIDKKTGIESFKFVLDGKIMQEYHFKHLSNNSLNTIITNIDDINQSQQLHQLLQLGKIDKRLFIDEEKIETNSRNINDISIYKALLSPTVIVKTSTELGAGFIINKQGRILTNWHVVNNHNEIFISFKQKNNSNLSKNNFYRAKIIKIDKQKDLALLEVEDKTIIKNLKITPLLFGDINQTEIGEDVYTIGHPIGYFYTFTNGILRNIINQHSWKIKTTKHKADYILMTQNSISSGNSGGALVTKDLKLIGIMTYTDTQGQNLNFAVSANDIKLFLDKKEYLQNKSLILSSKNNYYNVNFSDVNILKTIRVFDTKGNPMYIQKIDTTGNGIADIMLLDTTGDMKWNRVYYDYNEDGQIEKWTNL